MKELTEEEAYNKMAAFCSTAEHCCSEISEKLQRWGVAYDVIDRIIQHLEREGFIDEERYCRAFIRDKYRLAKWGKQKIAQGLYLKKISSKMAASCWDEINTEEYLENLHHLLETKKRSIHAETPYECKQKLIRFAVSRGFEMKDIFLFIDDSDIEAD